MATVLTNIMDRIIALMQGASASRSIATRRFRHIDMSATLTPQMAAQRPVPFTIAYATAFQPESIPSDLVSDQTWRGGRLEMVIAYTMQTLKELDLSKSQTEDDFAIRRTLGYPENYQVTGFSRAIIGQHAYTEIGDTGVILATYPIDITYREDFS